MKEFSQIRDWLDSVHDGLRNTRESLSILKQITRELQYAFPEIAKDIQMEILEIEENQKYISNAVSQSLSERLDDHNQFVGTMITSMLHLDKESD